MITNYKEELRQILKKGLQKPQIYTFSEVRKLVKLAIRTNPAEIKKNEDARMRRKIRKINKLISKITE